MKHCYDDKAISFCRLDGFVELQGDFERMLINKLGNLAPNQTSTVETFLHFSFHSGERGVWMPANQPYPKIMLSKWSHTVLLVTQPNDPYFYLLDASILQFQVPPTLPKGAVFSVSRAKMSEVNPIIGCSGNHYGNQLRVNMQAVGRLSMSHSAEGSSSGLQKLRELLKD
jgi:hypothetical protein